VTEQLIIRLGSRREEPIPWLVWSRGSGEVIACGELEGSDQLMQLAERAGGRPVLVLVPALDVTLRSVDLPGKANRQLLKALPYLLEDELCEDVDQLHLVPFGVAGAQARVAVVAHARMRQWLQWLADAGLTPQRLVPDVLALPCRDDAWQALELQDQWLIRTGPVSGFAIAADWLAAGLERAAAAEQPILSHTPVPADMPGQWRTDLAELPMQVLAEGVAACPVNLLCGSYQPVRQWRKYFRPLASCAALAVVCLLLMLANRLVEIHQLEARQQQLQQSSLAIYRQLFPREQRVVNLQVQLERHLRELGSGASDSGLLPLLAELQPVFAAVPSLRPTSLRYDAARDELRIQAQADSFQAFEHLRGLVPAGWQLEQGALTQQGQQVHGSVTFRRIS